MVIMTIEEILNRTNHIPSSFHEPEQKMWLEELQSLPGNPIIVDFGTGHGKSAVSLALACPQATVVTFDPGLPYINHTCTSDEYVEETEKYIKDAGVSNVIFTQESSLNKMWKDTKINVLNIDSDHTYETTKKELEIWLPLVKSGGYIFLHDWDHPRCPGVRQAWEEIVPSKFTDIEFKKATQSGEIQCAFFIKHA